MPGSAKWFLSVTFSNYNSVQISDTLNALCVCHPSQFNQPNIAM